MGGEPHWRVWRKEECLEMGKNVVSREEIWLMEKLKKWIPIGLSLLLIFGLTFQNSQASKQLTENTQIAIDRVIASNRSSSYWWNDYIFMRKLGHLVEYIPLGLSTCFAFRGWRALMFCVVVSFADQLIKEILPGREFDWIDMPFDFIGYVVGILAMAIVLRISNR